MLGVDVVHTNSLFDASYSYDLYSWCLSCLAATNRAATYRSTCVSSWNTWRAVISCTIFKCKSPLNLRDTEETESWPIGLEALLHKCLLACLLACALTHSLRATFACTMSQCYCSPVCTCLGRDRPCYWCYTSAMACMHAMADRWA